MKIEWKDSGDSPPLDSLLSYQLFLCAGGNKDGSYVCGQFFKYCFSKEYAVDWASPDLGPAQDIGSHGAVLDRRFSVGDD